MMIRYNANSDAMGTIVYVSDRAQFAVVRDANDGSLAITDKWCDCKGWYGATALAKAKAAADAGYLL